MMPTGGVALENIDDWFAAGAVAVGVGSNLCRSSWAEEGRLAEITGLAKEYCRAVESARNMA